MGEVEWGARQKKEKEEPRVSIPISLHRLQDKAQMRQSETRDPSLQCLRLDTPLLQQLNTKKLYMSSWGKFWTPKIQRDQKTQLLLLKSQEEKQGTAHAACSHHHRGMGKASKLLLLPDPWTHTYPYPVLGTSSLPSTSSEILLLAAALEGRWAEGVVGGKGLGGCKSLA